MRVFIPTCEAAVCTVPEWHRADLKGNEGIITSSEGWSPGALNLGQGIASKLRAPLVNADMTRLIIDLSKHPENEDRWSRLSSLLSVDQRERLDERQKKQYLNTIRQRIEDAHKRNEEALHLSVDTQPGMGDTWLSFGYDSRRSSEAEWVREWSDAIRSRLPEAVIRETGSPTRSLAGYLRSKYPDNFSSVQIVATQSSFLESKPIKWMDFKKVLLATIPM